MSNVLMHHGILGMKWGVRRTPAQLGHDTNGESGSSSGKSSTKEAEQKTPGRSARNPRVMSDDELRQRISRLNMEEQYENLVARQKERNTGKVKKALGNALEKFGDGVLSKVVDLGLKKMFDKDGKFDIDDWKNTDVNDMDADTIQKVSKWYANAKSITSARDSLNPKKDNSSNSSNSSGSSGSSGSSKPSSSRSTNMDDVVRERRKAMRLLGTR